jgi:hypothetical protein
MVFGWLKQSFGGKRESEALRVQQLRFLGEHDGVPERAIKQTWRALLAETPEVSRAYLAVVSINGQREPSVMLGIYPSVTDQKALAERLGAPFRQMFNQTQHIDIVFLTTTQDSDVAAVCHSFYEAT